MQPSSNHAQLVGADSHSAAVVADAIYQPPGILFACTGGPAVADIPYIHHTAVSQSHTLRKIQH